MHRRSPYVSLQKARENSRAFRARRAEQMQLLESQVEQLLSRNEVLEAQLQQRTTQGHKNEAEILTLRRLVAELSAVSGLSLLADYR